MGSKRTDAVRKSREKHDIVEIRFYISAEEKERIREFAQENGKPLATYIKDVIAADMKKKHKE